MLTVNTLKHPMIDGQEKLVLPNGRRLNFCKDCLMLNPPIFMLEDWPFGKDLLCWDCTSKRIGHPIQLHELKPDVPCNERWHYGDDPMDNLESSVLLLIMESGAEIIWPHDSTKKPVSSESVLLTTKVG
jgi:hypothetical protein